MQLFIVDRHPYIAAKNLADCHIRKQILETAQILTAVWVNSGHDRLDWMPRPQNYRHPVALAINTSHKVVWTLNHFNSLMIQYIHRFDKRHAYDQRELDRKYNDAFWSILPSMNPRNKDLSFCRMFSGFTPQSEDIVEAYREYYRYKARTIKNFKYTNATPPAWLTEGENK